MARVDNTGGAGYVIDNGTGAAVRTKLNQITAAVNSTNSGSGDPSINSAFQMHIDTSSSLLKIRNAANNAYITIGNVATTNLGLAALAGSTFTGKVTHNYTSSLTIPSGTTAQRDGSPAVGMFRHNSTLNQFEGYNNGAWGAIGGGAGATGGGTDEVFFESDTNVTTNYTITSGKNAHTVSPVINSGVTVTVPSGSLFVIL
nr:phage tail fiber protein [uncultured Mediterranean phage uvMED]